MYNSGVQMCLGIIHIKYVRTNIFSARCELTCILCILKMFCSERTANITTNELYEFSIWTYGHFH
jgi:hypothetical protein